MSESGSPPAGAKSRRMSRTTASGLHTLFRAQLSTDQWCSMSTCWYQGSLRPSLRSLSVCPRAVACGFSSAAQYQSRWATSPSATSNNGAAVWMLAIWIGVGFIFQGVTATALAIDVPALPERGWYVFVGILTVIAAGYCVADQSIDAFRRFHAALHSHQAAETDYLVLAMSTGVSVPGY